MYYRKRRYTGTRARPADKLNPELCQTRSAGSDLYKSPDEYNRVWEGPLRVKEKDIKLTVFARCEEPNIMFMGSSVRRRERREHLKVVMARGDHLRSVGVRCRCRCECW